MTVNVAAFFSRPLNVRVVIPATFVPRAYRLYVPLGRPFFSVYVQADVPLAASQTPLSHAPRCPGTEVNPPALFSQRHFFGVALAARICVRKRAISTFRMRSSGGSNVAPGRA